MSERDDEPADEGRASVPLLLARISSPSLPVKAGARFSDPLPRAAVLAWEEPAARSRRIGAVALVVAALLLLVAVFADLVASDAPLLCRDREGTLLVLPNLTHATATEPRWRVSAPVPYGPRTIAGAPLEAPSGRHLLGTDRAGHDVLARTIHGTRSYLFFALAAVAVALALGALLGGLAGLFAGATDALVSRAIESIAAFPPLVLVLGVQAAVPRPTLVTLFAAIALTRWPAIARLVRGEVVVALTRDYVLAARALGASPLRILWRHVVPNVRTPIVVAAAVNVGAVVLTEAALDFLGIGATGGASWGETMSELRGAPHATWLVLAPGTLLVATILAFHLLGEALRTLLDPRSR